MTESPPRNIKKLALPPDLIPFAHQLISAVRTESIAGVKALLEAGAPAWFQDEELGWSCLHYAAEKRNPQLLQTLIKGGAVWNAVDKWGQTAGEICLSLGDQEGWEMIRNEGIRTEMLHHILSAPSSSEDHIALRAEDDTSSGDNIAFLASKLTWETGEDGRERVIDADGNGVMMGWEEPLMEEHVRLMPDGENHSVLNIGYGLGIVRTVTTVLIQVDRLFQARKPVHHTIVEAHPQVLQHMRDTGVYDWPGVRVLEGRWQDWFAPEKLGEVIGATPDASGFTAVFMDTFAEGYEDLKSFFEVLPDILDSEEGVFSFWNGLGATNPTIYAVASSLAELHIEDVGLSVVWHDVPIPDSLREEVWKGVRRRYWDLPGYRLPTARLSLM